MDTRLLSHSIILWLVAQPAAITVGKHKSDARGD
jgi:hypothetical protein